jgi:hypothetical protein
VPKKKLGKANNQPVFLRSIFTPELSFQKVSQIERLIDRIAEKDERKKYDHGNYHFGIHAAISRHALG